MFLIRSRSSAAMGFSADYFQRNIAVSVLAVFAYWAVGSAILACPGLAVVAELAPLATDVSLLLASPISFVFIAGVGVESLGIGYLVLAFAFLSFVCGLPVSF